MNEQEKYGVLLKYVRKMARAPDGAWNNDREQYLNNVITNMMDEAKEALETVGEGLDG